MTENEIKTWLDKMDIKYYRINDSIVDVDGDVKIRGKSLTTIPVKFGHVKGNFYCSCNKLKSLRNSPQKVGGLFDCYWNKLETLEHITQDIGKRIHCANNPLYALTGLNPIHINRVRGVRPELIEDFKFFNCPNYVHPTIDIHKATKYLNVDHLLTNEEDIEKWLDTRGVLNYEINRNNVNVLGNVDIHAELLTIIPVQFGFVSGWFDCSDNDLTNLKGCPHTVGYDFDCSNNRLETLSGGPKKVGSNYCAKGNDLINLDGIAKSIGHYISFDDSIITKYELDPTKSNNDKILERIGNSNVNK